MKDIEYKLVQVLFYIFPLSFVIGNFFLNLNLLLFILISLFLIKRKKLRFRFSALHWLLIAFFLYVFLLTSFRFLGTELSEAIRAGGANIVGWPFKNNPIFKSLIASRFLILIFIIDTLLFNKILNIKKFFLSSLICSTFVSFDVILQYFLGYDVFGYNSDVLGARNSGPFKDELIAGSYLQKFSFISIFYAFVLIKEKNFNKFFLIFIMLIHVIGILLAGNRMPMLLFLFGSFLTIIFIRHLRLSMIVSLLIFTSIFFVVIKNNQYFNSSYVSLFNEINIFNYIKKQKIKNEKLDEGGKYILTETEADTLSREGFLGGAASGHGGIFRSAISVWSEDPIFGFGLKSFRIKCWKNLDIHNAFTPKILFDIAETKLTRGCSTHPHHYYLEVLVETGIIGFGLLFVLFIILFKDSLVYLIKNYRSENIDVNLLTPIMILFFTEIWPIRTSGSFFSTWNATYFWLIISFLIAAKTKKIF